MTTHARGVATPEAIAAALSWPASADELRPWREENGWSRSSLADALGLPSAAIKRAEGVSLNADDAAAQQVRHWTRVEAALEWAVPPHCREAIVSTVNDVRRRYSTTMHGIADARDEAIAKRDAALADLAQAEAERAEARRDAIRLSFALDDRDQLRIELDEARDHVLCMGELLAEVEEERDAARAGADALRAVCDRLQAELNERREADVVRLIASCGRVRSFTPRAGLYVCTIEVTLSGEQMREVVNAMDAERRESMATTRKWLGFGGHDDQNDTTFSYMTTLNGGRAGDVVDVANYGCPVSTPADVRRAVVEAMSVPPSPIAEDEEPMYECADWGDQCCIGPRAAFVERSDGTLWCKCGAGTTRDA